MCLGGTVRGTEFCSHARSMGEISSFKMSLDKQQVMINTYCYSPPFFFFSLPSVGVDDIAK